MAERVPDEDHPRRGRQHARDGWFYIRTVSSVRGHAENK